MRMTTASLPTSKQRKQSCFALSWRPLAACMPISGEFTDGFCCDYLLRRCQRECLWRSQSLDFEARIFLEVTHLPTTSLVMRNCWAGLATNIPRRLPINLFVAAKARGGEWFIWLPQ